LPPAITPTKPGASTKRGPSRTRQVADHIKALIVKEGLRPGDRLPNEATLIEKLDKSKGTVREAMRMLEAEGLIRTRTGPGGGAFLAEMSGDLAATLLANFFYFKDLSIDDLYQLRILLEPEVAADVAGRLPAAVLARFRTETRRFDLPPATPEEERAQHVTSLEFHRELAKYCSNPLLGFMVDFIAKVLSDLTVFRGLYEPHNHELWARGHAYHNQLLEALEAGDATAARVTMQAHMETAFRLMHEQEAAVGKGFLG
jgi:GntR family transcriptional regulator, transcriptional repressor for pyruvate dehydrogenase complex